MAGIGGMQVLYPGMIVMQYVEGMLQVCYVIHISAVLNVISVPVQ